MSGSVRLPKVVLVGFLLLAMVISFMFSPFMQKADASVSWGQEVTEVAKQYKGTPYKWGGNTSKAFDASGFTQFIFKTSAAKIQLPHSSKAQYKLGKAVKPKDLKEGDLVFFNTNEKNVSFVGIYLGKNQFIAVTVKNGVSVQSFTSKYWKDRYVGAKRVLKE